MEKNIRFVLAGLFAACMIFLMSTVALFFMRQLEIEKRILSDKKVEDLSKEKSQLSKQLDDAHNAKRDLEAKISAVESQVKSIEGQLSEEKNLRGSVASQLESEKNASKRLVEEMMKLKDEKEGLSSSLSGIKGECDALKIRLETIQQAKQMLETKLKEALTKREVELEKIVVTPDNAEAQAPPAEQLSGKQEFIPEADPPPDNENAKGPAVQRSVKKGEVMVVNKKFDFVIINIGEDDGMKPGMDVGVYRNNKFLAFLKIEKVHANMSAAKIPPEWKNSDIKEGDAVSAAN